MSANLDEVNFKLSLRNVKFYKILGKYVNIKTQKIRGFRPGFLNSN